ncbi:MAG: hypothetical protein Q9227_007626 [Pyrenula ochraceoflavens]
MEQRPAAQQSLEKDIEKNNGIVPNPNSDNDSGDSLRRTATEEEYGSRPKCFETTFQEILFVLTATLAIGQSSILIGATQVITAYIAQDLHMNQSEVTWLNAASSLTAGSFLLLFGKLADLFGRRPIFIGSMASFTIFLLVLGFSPSGVVADLFMGFIGLCSAAAVPPAIGSLGAVYKRPSKRKNRAFACFSAGNPLGFVVGLFVSGVATNIADWRASYWTLAVLYFIFTVLAFWTVPADDTTRVPINFKTLSKVDWLGALLAITGLALFTSALTLAPDAPNGWSTPYVPVLLVLGILLTSAFLYRQTRIADPLLPIHIFASDRTFSLLVTTLCLGFLSFSTTTFWLSLFLQSGLHLSPLHVAVRLLPMAIGGILVNVAAAFLMHRISNKLLMLVGALAYVACFALLSAMPDPSSHHHRANTDWYWPFVFPALLLAVVGADLEFTVTNMYVMSALPRENQSVAGGLFNTLTRLSTSVGLGVTTAVYGAMNGGDAGGVSERLGPYRGTFWVAVGCAGLGVVFVPFVRVGRQGERRRGREKGQEREKKEEEEEIGEEKGKEEEGSGDNAVRIGGPEKELEVENEKQLENGKA